MPFTKAYMRESVMETGPGWGRTTQVSEIPPLTCSQTAPAQCQPLEATQVLVPGNKARGEGHSIMPSRGAPARGGRWHLVACDITSDLLLRWRKGEAREESSGAALGNAAAPPYPGDRSGRRSHERRKCRVIRGETTECTRC